MSDAQPDQVGNPTPAPQAGPAKSWFVQEASQLIRKNQLDQARKVLQNGIDRYPGQGDLVWRMADVSFRQGDGKQALKWIKSVEKTPKTCNARFYCAAARLGLTMGDKGLRERMLKIGLERFGQDSEINYLTGRMLTDHADWQGAARHLEIAVNLKPKYAEAMTSYGFVLDKQRDYDRALRVLTQAVALNGRDVNAQINLGNVLYAVGRYDEALERYHDAMRLSPRTFLHANMAALYRRRYDFEKSQQHNRIAQVIEPPNPGFIYNYGNLLKETGELDAACREYRKALCFEPENGAYHWNLALARLASGDLADGFREYEWRWKYSNFPSRPRNFTQPQWGGEALPGKVLLVHAEQGIGDHLQFARFIPLICERVGAGGRVILECHGEILSLFEHYADQVELVERLHPPEDFDCHLPLLSTPHVLGLTDWADMPGLQGYLVPPADFRFEIPELNPAGRNVGIIWGGNPQFSGDFERSAKLDYYLPLLKIDGVRLFSLQKGAREPELRDAPAEIVRLSERITDFCDTASIMSQLDLVITTCTSTAHLAGALGVPCWVALCHNPDWRWLRNREDSPWYGNTRLFRQTTPGDWEGVFDRIDQALRAPER
jgi:tetratricopeptide (TPR) repeat protein